MDRLFTTGRVAERRLTNGLRVIIREDHSAPVVAIVTYIMVGYFDEPDELAGISHVLEHMFFKGTPSRGPGEIAQQTKAAGGVLNAHTIYDHTTYYTVLPSSSLERGLAIQSDALINSSIDADELRRELQVIIQEAKRKLDNPPAVAQETLYELMFDRHRMRRWRIGTEAMLSSLTRDQLYAFYRQNYRASSATLIVAGDVDADRASAAVEAHYSGLPGGDRPRDRGPAEPPRSEFRFREQAGDIVHAHLEIGWQTEPTRHDAMPALDLLGVLLGQGRAARLYRTVREAGLAHAISARNYSPTELGVFQISAELEPDCLLPALEAIAGTVRGLRDSLRDEELVRAKRIIEARVVKRLESMEGQANYLAEWAALGDWKLGEQYLADIDRLTAANLVDAANQYLRLDAAAVFAYRPAAAPPLGWSAERLGSYLRTTQVLKTVSPLAPSMLATRNGTQAKLDRIEDDVHVFQADSGIQIVVKPRRSAPLVSVALTVAGGANLESGPTAGFTSLLARTSLKGTRSRSAAQLALAAEALGASLVPTVTADVLDWYISVPSRQFEAALDLVLDVAFQPSLPGDELELEKKFALADLQEVRDDMYRYPLRLMLQGGFGGHAYGFSIAEVEQAVAAATADQVRSWHDSIVTRNRPSVFVVGDVDPDVVARQVASRLPALTGQTPAPRAPEWPASPIRIIEPRDKRQTALALAFPAVDRNHPDLYALQLLANTIAGLGGRLFEELRSRRSLAYTVTAYPIARGLGGAFVGYIATSPEREDEARNGLLGELERVREERLPQAELERAREYTIGSWQIRAQTNGVQLSDLANALLIGRGLLEIREFEERVRAVTAEDIRNAAQRYFDTGRLVEAIVRGSGGGR